VGRESYRDIISVDTGTSDDITPISFTSVAVQLKRHDDRNRTPELNRLGTRTCSGPSSICSSCLSQRVDSDYVNCACIKSVLGRANRSDTRQESVVGGEDYSSGDLQSGGLTSCWCYWDMSVPVGLVGVYNRGQIPCCHGLSFRVTNVQDRSPQRSSPSSRRSINSRLQR
jgi:hypothetical protein